MIENLASQIETACLLEATAPKPGNVHPRASFKDLCYEDFVRAARAISEPLAAARITGVGLAILNAVNATRKATGTNVNLGIVILLAPLAAVSSDISLESGLEAILESTTIEDAEFAFTAIRVAKPGGLGKVSSHDVADRPTINLKTAMSLAVDRDRIAEQYVNGFQHVFEARRQFCKFYDRYGDWNSAIVWLHIWMLSRWPDTLIARKCGQEIANEATLFAQQLMVQFGKVGTVDTQVLQEFDDWLRVDGNRRNPGTTADLIAATLFATFRDRMIEAPELHNIKQLISPTSRYNSDGARGRPRED